MKNPRTHLKYIIEEKRDRLEAIKNEWNLNDDQLVLLENKDKVFADSRYSIRFSRLSLSFIEKN